LLSLPPIGFLDQYYSSLSLLDGARIKRAG